MNDCVNRPEPPAWPHGINLPAGQAGRTDDEWVDTLDELIATREAGLDVDTGATDRLREIRDWHLDRL